MTVLSGGANHVTMGDDPLSFLSEDGWPYPDDDDLEEQLEPIDLRSEADDDLVSLHALRHDAVIDLTRAERVVIAYRFGFDGHPPRTLAQLHEHLGMSHEEIRVSLVQGLDKLRSRLNS